MDQEGEPVIRRHPRLQRPLPARWIEITGPKPARIVDLSVGGCCVQSDVAPPAPGQGVLLQLQFADRPLVIAGKVAWAQTGRRFGVAFVVVSTEQRTRLIQQLLDFARLEPGYLGGGGTEALNGGLIATGFDAVCVLVALGHVDTDTVATLTLQVQYLRLASTTPGLAFRAQALKVAKHVVFVQAVLEDQDTGRGPAAIATATLAPLPRALRADAVALAA